MTRAFFTVESRSTGEWFLPTDACRGPWDPDACHAGPPTGLLARASERLVPAQRLVRLTVDLIRPIPHRGFGIVSSITRSGRTVTTTELTIVDHDGTPVVTARGMHLAPQPVSDLPTTPHPVPSLADAQPGPFPFARTAHGLTGFTSGVEVRYPPGEEPTPGPTVMWMRTLPLIEDEEASGFQRICPLADCGNATSRNADPGDLAFVNTDLTIMLHREPRGEWFGTESVSRWEADGIGLADSLLFDEHGAVGRAMQSLVIRRT